MRLLLISLILLMSVGIANADWLCFDQGKIFTYENKAYPARLTTITVLERNDTFWKIEFEKNHPETYWGSYDPNLCSQLIWWGFQNDYGVFARGGQAYNYNWKYLWGMQYFAQREVKIPNADNITESGYPVYILLPPESEIPSSAIQTQSGLMYIGGETIWYDYDWIAEWTWDIVWVPYLGENRKAIKAHYKECGTINSVDEIWWFVEDIGVVQIKSTPYLRGEPVRTDIIRLIGVE